MKHFEFNEFDVCTNSNTYFKAGNNEERYRIEIHTAQRPSKEWCCSINVNNSDSGIGALPHLTRGQTFKTEDEAGRYGLRKAKAFFVNSSKIYKATTQPLPEILSEKAYRTINRNAIKAIDEALKPKVTQLMLFSEI